MDGLYNVYVILFIGLQCACVRAWGGWSALGRFGTNKTLPFHAQHIPYHITVS